MKEPSDEDLKDIIINGGSCCDWFDVKMFGKIEECHSVCFFYDKIKNNFNMCNRENLFRYCEDLLKLRRLKEILRND